MKQAKCSLAYNFPITLERLTESGKLEGKGHVKKKLTFKLRTVDVFKRVVLCQMGQALHFWGDLFTASTVFGEEKMHSDRFILFLLFLMT